MGSIVSYLRFGNQTAVDSAIKSAIAETSTSTYLSILDQQIKALECRLSNESLSPEELQNAQTQLKSLKALRQEQLAKQETKMLH